MQSLRLPRALSAGGVCRRGIPGDPPAPPRWVFARGLGKTAPHGRTAAAGPPLPRALLAFRQNFPELCFRTSPSFIVSYQVSSPPLNSHVLLVAQAVDQMLASSPVKPHRPGPAPDPAVDSPPAPATAETYEERRRPAHGDAITEERERARGEDGERLRGGGAASEWVRVRRSGTSVNTA